MRFFIPYVFAFLLIGSGKCFSAQVQERYDAAMKRLSEASTDLERFHALDSAAKESFNVGKIDDASKYATEVLLIAAKYPKDWNFGNAIQDGNIVLGRVALQNGKKEDAKKYLIAAGKSPGSPTMNSFGPNMSLAKDLLEKGERDVVLEYFNLCHEFWRQDYGQLNKWRDEVKAGKIPHFGANLIY